MTAVSTLKMPFTARFWGSTLRHRAFCLLVPRTLVFLFRQSIRSCNESGQRPGIGQDWAERERGRQALSAELGSVPQRRARRQPLSRSRRHIARFGLASRHATGSGSSTCSQACAACFAKSSPPSRRAAATVEVANSTNVALLDRFPVHAAYQTFNARSHALPPTACANRAKALFGIPLLS